MLNDVELQNQLIDYIYKVHLATVTPDDDILETGIIQSMDFIILVSFIEKISEIVIPQNELTQENFKSINAIVNYVTQIKNL